MLRRFFQDYKQLEGKAVEVDEIQPAAKAYPIINDALHRYSEQRRKGFKGFGGPLTARGLSISDALRLVFDFNTPRAGCPRDSRLGLP